MLTPCSVEVTWTPSSSPNVNGYIISYITTASYTSGGSVMVNGSSATNYIVDSLEEATTYTITVQATTTNISSCSSNKVQVTTYTDGK